MRALSLAITLAAACATAGLAQTTPFADLPTRPGASQAPLLVLSDLMGIAQLRHAKLWQAGKAGDWQLAGYEAGKLRDSLYRAATLYVNIPVGLVTAADEPLEAAVNAAAARDAKAFDAAFRRATEACNSCHQAAGVGFIRMRMPTSAPFTNQEIGAGRK